VAFSGRPAVLPLPTCCRLDLSPELNSSTF
jgi:hypothetical protein